jgi:hypothetical protein
MELSDFLSFRNECALPLLTEAGVPHLCFYREVPTGGNELCIAIANESRGPYEAIVYCWIDGTTTMQRLDDNASFFVSSAAEARILLEGFISDTLGRTPIRPAPKRSDSDRLLRFQEASEFFGSMQWRSST